jgi:DNA-binding MarR family transcriptional regulator
VRLPKFTRVYNDERLLKRAKYVYFHLRDREKDGIAWPGINKMAHDLSMSRNTVKRALADLERLGYIRKEAFFLEDGKQASNRYFILK